MEAEILDEKPTCSGIGNREYQTLNVIISTGQSKEYLGKTLSVKDLETMSSDQIEVFYRIYELTYANKIGENLVGTIINVYATVVNKVLPIDDVEKLQTDLNNDYILTTELKSLMGPVARTCGKLLSLFSLSFITLKHVKKQCQEMCNNEELCKEHYKEQ